MTSREKGNQIHDLNPACRLTWTEAKRRQWAGTEKISNYCRQRLNQPRRRSNVPRPGGCKVTWQRIPGEWLTVIRNQFRCWLPNHSAPARAALEREFLKFGSCSNINININKTSQQWNSPTMRPSVFRNRPLVVEVLSIFIGSGRVVTSGLQRCRRCRQISTGSHFTFAL